MCWHNLSYPDLGWTFAVRSAQFSSPGTYLVDAQASSLRWDCIHKPCTSKCRAPPILLRVMVAFAAFESKCIDKLWTEFEQFTHSMQQVSWTDTNNC